MSLKVGDKIKVINEGLCYNTFDSWRGLQKLKNWSYGNSLNGMKGKIGIVKVITPHNNNRLVILCGITIKGKDYIIGIKGLKKIGNKNNKLEILKKQLLK